MDRLERLADTPQRRLTALLTRAEVAGNQGRYADAVRLGEAAAEQARRLNEPEREVEALRCAAAAASFDGDSQRAVRLLRPALPWVLQHGSPQQQQSFFNDFACCLDYADLPTEAEPFHRRALELALQQGRLNDASSVYGNLTACLRDGGSLRQAFDNLQQARRLTAGYDEAQGATWALDLMAFALLRDLARYSDSLRASEVALHSMAQHPYALPVAHGHLACLWIHLGQPARALQALVAARQLPGAPQRRARFAQLQGRAQWSLGQGAKESLATALADAPMTGRTVLQSMIALDHALVIEPDAALAASLQVRQRCEIGRAHV